MNFIYLEGSDELIPVLRNVGRIEKVVVENVAGSIVVLDSVVCEKATLIFNEKTHLCRLIGAMRVDYKPPTKGKCFALNTTNPPKRGKK